jgi:diguanylate cyclase (GGDEF)-like protein
MPSGRQRIKSEFLVTTEILIIVIGVSLFAHLLSRFFSGDLFIKLLNDFYLNLKSVDLEWYENGWETLFFIILAAPIFYYRALQRSRNFDKIWTLANTDTLTGLYNRRYLSEILDREFKLVKRFNNYSASILLIDIDNFKAVNDTYGHSVGDRIIQEVANLLRTKTRSYCVSARYGGEEFIQVIPNTQLDDIKSAADHLLTAISEKPFVVKGKIINITISIGVALIPCPECFLDCKGCTVEGWLELADRALYRSKSEGKNRVTFAM